MALVLMVKVVVPLPLATCPVLVMKTLSFSAIEMSFLLPLDIVPTTIMTWD